MAAGGAFKVEGTLVAVLSDRVFRVELANRHQFIGHLAAGLRAQAETFSPGDRVTVEMTPYDLSKGRIILKN